MDLDRVEEREVKGYAKYMNIAYHVARYLCRIGNRGGGINTFEAASSNV